MREARSGAAAAVLAVASFVSGCSGSPSEPSAADAMPTESTQADSTQTNSVAPAATVDSTAPQPSAGAAPSPDGATYHVPVPPELEPYSNFQLGDLRSRAHGGEWELEYTLPELLVGGHQELSFRGSARATGEYDLLGDAGQLTCHSVGATMACDEVLSRVELDREKLQRSFASLTAEESAARWAVANRFSDDPIGVLTFPAQLLRGD